MGGRGTGRTAERIQVEGELFRWFVEQGINEGGASRALRLLDANTLDIEPRPSRWNRRGEFGVQERRRYFWYRHAARILGWGERKPFPGLVTEILRNHIFPSAGGRDEASRANEEGRLTDLAPQRRGDIAADSEPKSK